MSNGHCPSGVSYFNCWDAHAKGNENQWRGWLYPNALGKEVPRMKGCAGAVQPPDPHVSTHILQQGSTCVAHQLQGADWCAQHAQAGPPPLAA